MLRRLDSRGRDGRYERELAFFYKRLANNNLWALVSLSVKEKKRTFIPKVAAGFFFLVHSNSAQLRITSRSVQRHEYVSLTSAVALAATSWVRSLWNLPGIIQIWQLVNNICFCLLNVIAVHYAGYSSIFKVDWGHYGYICFDSVLGRLNLKVKSRKKHSAAAKNERRAERAIFNSRIKLRPCVAVLFFTPCFFPSCCFPSLLFFLLFLTSKARCRQACRT